MFAQSTTAFAIVTAMAYFVSAPWIVGTQAIRLRSLVPGRGVMGSIGLTIVGEVGSLLVGGVAVAAVMDAVDVALVAAGVPAAVQDVILVNDLHRPVAAGAMLLVWLVVWAALVSPMKALLLKTAWGLTPIPWRLAFRLSARAYLGTAVVTIAMIVAVRLG